jgi:hypothetical protein
MSSPPTALVAATTLVVPVRKPAGHRRDLRGMSGRRSTSIDRGRGPELGELAQQRAAGKDRRPAA